MSKPKKAKKEKTPKAEGDAGAKKGGMVGKLALVIVMGATSFSTVFFLPRPTPMAAVAADDAHAKPDKHEELPPEPVETAFLDMKSFTVSLKGRDRVLRLGVAIESPVDMVDYIDADSPQLRDAFMGYLSAIDMAQVEDAAFLVRLRSQLTRRAKFVLGEASVHNILITDFLVR